MKLVERDIERAVYGGTILGGGGGGRAINGLEMARYAFAAGEINLMPIDSLNDDDIIVTTTSIGAPSAKEKFVTPEYYLKAVTNLEKYIGVAPAGFITGENGATETVDAWMQSAVFGKPVIDAPVAGRAVPTAIMGSMGLFKDEGYLSTRSVLGGNPATGHYLEMVVQGSFGAVASIVRKASVDAGGTVVVARDPVKASLVKERAALGGITQAIELGEVYLTSKERGAEYCVKSICEKLGGKIIGHGPISDLAFNMTGGFDVGELSMKDQAGGKDIKAFFWNEYMGIEMDGERIATFPDLIMTFNAADGCPVVSADLKKDMDIYLIAVKKELLNLGYGLTLVEPFKDAEIATGRDIIKYL